MNYCYVFIGPSGSGKTSLAEAIFQPEQKIKRIIILFLTIHSIR